MLTRPTLTPTGWMIPSACSSLSDPASGHSDGVPRSEPEGIGKVHRREMVEMYIKLVREIQRYSDIYRVEAGIETKGFDFRIDDVSVTIEKDKSVRSFDLELCYNEMLRRWEYEQRDCSRMCMDMCEYDMEGLLNEEDFRDFM